MLAQFVLLSVAGAKHVVFYSLDQLAAAKTFKRSCTGVDPREQHKVQSPCVARRVAASRVGGGRWLAVEVCRLGGVRCKWQLDSEAGGAVGGATVRGESCR